ncbi:MAG: c-type cytochrome [Gammaproteobacteria bacterium]|nr:c-type cytochrome [Gammaproteobacteria bacterium]
MQFNSQVKLFSMLTGILLFNGVLLNDAYGDSASTSSNIVRGSELWENNCARCHNYRAPTEYSPRSWHVIMQHMRIQAGLTSQEASDVLAFLAHSAAPKVSNAPQGTNTPAVSTANVATDSTSLSTKSKTAATVNKSQQQAKSTSQITSTNSGKKVYHKTCIACHGANGKGTIPGAPNFTKKNGPLSKSDSVLLQHTINGYRSPGSPMAMPPKGGDSNLTNDELSNAITYIRQSFSK